MSVSKLLRIAVKSLKNSLSMGSFEEDEKANLSVQMYEYFVFISFVSEDASSCEERSLEIEKIRWNKKIVGELF